MSVLDLLTQRKTTTEKQRITAERAAQKTRDAVRQAIAASVDGDRHDESLIVEFFESALDPVEEYERACESYRACVAHSEADRKIQTLTAEVDQYRAETRELRASITTESRRDDTGNRTWTEYPPLVAAKLDAERELAAAISTNTDTREQHSAVINARCEIWLVESHLDWLSRVIHRITGQIERHTHIRNETNAQFDDASGLASPLNFRLPAIGE